MSRYYYAGGERISIERDDSQVAVDQGKAIDADLRSAVEKAAGASRLPGGVLLLPRSALDEVRMKRLQKAGAIRPVYRRGQALMVALPEIRVELDDAKQRRAVVAAIPKAPHPVKVTEEGEDRLLLTPASGNAEEALDIANFVYEHAHPASAAVRFVQVVRKPDTHR